MIEWWNDGDTDIRRPYQVQLAPFCGLVDLGFDLNLGRRRQTRGELALLHIGGLDAELRLAIRLGRLRSFLELGQLFDVLELLLLSHRCDLVNLPLARVLQIGHHVMDHLCVGYRRDINHGQERSRRARGEGLTFSFRLAAEDIF